MLPVNRTWLLNIEKSTVERMEIVALVTKSRAPTILLKKVNTENFRKNYLDFVN